MKFLVVLLVIVAVLWLVRGAGRRIGGGAPPPMRPPPLQDSIVACAQCGLHLPSGEALPGRNGVFCCETHRSAHERAHPPA